MESIKTGNRVKWVSQARGVWKVKIGTVTQIYEKNYVVLVDTLIPVTEKLARCGEDEILKKPHLYTPRKTACEKI